MSLSLCSESRGWQWEALLHSPLHCAYGPTKYKQPDAQATAGVCSFQKALIFLRIWRLQIPVYHASESFYPIGTPEKEAGKRLESPSLLSFPLSVSSLATWEGRNLGRSEWEMKCKFRRKAKLIVFTAWNWCIWIVHPFTCSPCVRWVINHPDLEKSQ